MHSTQWVFSVISMILPHRKCISKAAGGGVEPTSRPHTQRAFMTTRFASLSRAFHNAIPAKWPSLRPATDTLYTSQLQFCMLPSPSLTGSCSSLPTEQRRVELRTFFKSGGQESNLLGLSPGYSGSVQVANQSHCYPRPIRSSRAVANYQASPPTSQACHRPRRLRKCRSLPAVKPVS